VTTRRTGPAPAGSGVDPRGTTPDAPVVAVPSEPVWLDRDEQATWRAFLACHRLVFAALEDDLRAAGLPLAYYEILVQLSEAPGRSLRMSELASYARTSRSRLSHAVERMEQQGWVRREGCPTDGRGAVAVLTATGWAVLGAAAPGHAARVRELIFDVLGPEQQHQLRALSATLAGRLCPRAAAELA
jgi:DNA-binding MarR family transcriptional regulator